MIIIVMIFFVSAFARVVLCAWLSVIPVAFPHLFLYVPKGILRSIRVGISAAERSLSGNDSFFFFCSHWRIPGTSKHVFGTAGAVASSRGLHASSTRVSKDALFADFCVWW